MTTGIQETPREVIWMWCAAEETGGGEGGGKRDLTKSQSCENSKRRMNESEACV
jgi:hypothetical protein